MKTSTQFRIWETVEVILSGANAACAINNLFKLNTQPATLGLLTMIAINGLLALWMWKSAKQNGAIANFSAKLENDMKDMNRGQIEEYLKKFNKN